MGTRRRASGGADPRPPRPGGQEAATGPGYIHLVPRPRGPIGDVAGVMSKSKHVKKLGKLGQREGEAKRENDIT